MSERLDELKKLFDELNANANDRRTFIGEVQADPKPKAQHNDLNTIILGSLNVSESNSYSGRRRLRWNMSDEDAARLRDLDLSRSELQKQICVIVEQVSEQDVLEYLLSRLSNGDKDFNNITIKALGWTKNTKAVAPLVDVLRHDEDEELRGSAADALGRIGDKSAIQPLIEVLQDRKEWKLRWACTDALGAIRDPVAIEPLVEALIQYDSDILTDNSDLREAARDSLAAIGGEVVTNRLIELYRQPSLHLTDYRDESIRCEIIMALGHIANPIALEFVLGLAKDANPEIRASVLSALMEHREPAVEQLFRDALQDSDESVKLIAEVAQNSRKAQ